MYYSLIIRRGYSFIYLLTPYYLKAIKASTLAEKTAINLTIWLPYPKPRSLAVTPY